MSAAGPAADNAAGSTTGSSQANAVDVRNLRVRFGTGPDAVGGISFGIAPGECFALVGESGSGKSVTARSLVGLTGGSVTADRLEVAGVDVRSLGRRGLERLRGAAVGTISQDALVALDPLRLVGREVEDALRLHTDLSPVDRRARVRELLELAGIPDPEVRAGQRSGELSGGLRQRALIAAAIAASPAVLVADEPTTALDSQVRDGILELVRRQADAGVAVLLISHDLSVVRAIADRVAVMRGGVILEEGPTSRVLESPSHDYTRALLAASPVGRPRHHVLLAGATVPEGGAVPGGATVPGGTTVPEGGATVPEGGAVPVPAQPPHTRTVIPPGAPAPSSALRAVDLRLDFPSPGGAPRRVLDRVSFELPTGSTLGLVGASGSGKTTIARIALGLQRPDGGELLLFGERWSSLPERERRSRRGSIGAVYQDPLTSFDPRFTVGEILTDAVTRGAHLRSRPASAPRVRELLHSVGLDPSVVARRPRHLSGGQRQRVAIARALGAEPRVLILDEPVSSLDVSVQAQILDLLDALQKALGLSYLFISHDMDVIGHMSDAVLRLEA